MSDFDTAPVTVTLLQLEPLPPGSMGRVTHLAVCDVEWAGIGFQVQGVRVQRGPDGCARVLPPVWRHPRDGRWLPGLILPDALQAAIAAEVLAACQEAADGGAARLPLDLPAPRATSPRKAAAHAPMMGGG